MKAFLFSFLALFFIGSVTHAADSLKVVPHDKVCMVTNKYFATTQIPVTHEGKTYYGCCDNCKKTLSQDAKYRNGKDALTGETVDKATAIIAANANNDVLYFSNQKNLDTYQKKSAATAEKKN